MRETLVANKNRPRERIKRASSILPMSFDPDLTSFAMIQFRNAYRFSHFPVTNGQVQRRGFFIAMGFASSAAITSDRC